ncbi:MAG: XRE family transcriptional regulator [Planctomycetota bacterium]|nr:MAG: XRE family transcriptional regulator [Planctomycetota bacterium]REJ95900.1 MAG: XRE family transcriptional regulator [Planctomycetota bacterium]REK25288.1 MAG: XRE family transcriptional regulator [Planctomycetota bacterium]REK37982.1 MAG: XRE family transcriptional regulator [Planctomycetota bacterium]
MKRALDQLIVEAQLSLEQLAEKAKLPSERVAAMLDGRWTPSPRDREMLAAAFGLSPDEIIWGHTMDPRNVRYRQFGLEEDIS